MDSKRPLNLPWLFKMAWRDSRRNRSRLFLFISSIILGIAALVAIYSFGDNLAEDIDDQAATLLGADLVVSSNKKPSDKIVPLLDSIGNDRSKEQSFASMVLFPTAGGTRLVQIRALEGNYPYYGEIETDPAAAGKTFRQGRDALVDKTLMLQFNTKVGDSIKVGELSFEIAGVLNKAPGQTGLSSSIAPIVYIPFRYLQETGLMQRGSRVNYKYFYRIGNATEVEKTLKKISGKLEKEGLDYDTIASQKKDTGRSFEDLTQFLSLVGFIALLLGCIGVASSIHIYIREKINSIAVLRCLGLKGWEAFLIYLIQIAGIGLIGGIIGAAIGTLVQQLLPLVLKDILPVAISSNISWAAIGQGILLGLVISVLFGLLPLISIRKISPLNTLRVVHEGASKINDPLKWLVYALVLLFIVAFGYFQLDGIKQALIFTAGVIVSFLVLTGIASLLVWMVRRFFPTSGSYLLRQGLANLFRPNNQTLILIVTIGLGTAFISNLFLVQDILIKRVSLSASGNQPNMVLFDIQPEQKQEVARVTQANRLPIIQQVPIITVRIEEINGKTAAEVKKDSSSKISPKAFGSELRVTFRDTLTAAERISEGKWRGNTAKDGTIYVSLEEQYANRIRVNVGDTLTFNVQGALVPTIVGSFREVDWNRIQTNFRVLFPKGVLEDAPQFHVLITRVPDSKASVSFQQQLVQKFPNISVIDLTLVLSVLDEILTKIGFVIKFMAAFSIVTGIVVLIASVLISKYQRIQESVLLRTMGAKRRQILIITALEYFFLGALASFTGILLSILASWALAKFSFKTAFAPDLSPALVLFVAISMLTVIIGLFNIRGILNRPPLEVLRKDL
ncbi:ABC transporter permease [Desertivirga brevis]|uniref:ABC transporter permease n=1 Tax=Desertivirga brevis TaxID=2810310 RepID=UPI001A958A3A|nr:FtsX-like permease family protein [Pedobacter sp. SYSU D00873]